MELVPQGYPTMCARFESYIDIQRFRRWLVEITLQWATTAKVSEHLLTNLKAFLPHQPSINTRIQWFKKKSKRKWLKKHGGWEQLCLELGHLNYHAIATVSPDEFRQNGLYGLIEFIRHPECTKNWTASTIKDICEWLNCIESLARDDSWLAVTFNKTRLVFDKAHQCNTAVIIQY
jgi:hypothetical protein